MRSKMPYEVITNGTGLVNGAIAMPGNPLDERVLNEQLKLLYSFLPIGLLATLVNSVVVVGLHRDLVPRPVLLAWLLLQVIVSAGRVLVYTCGTREVATGLRLELWKRRFLAGAAASGLVWGTSAFFSMYHDSEPHRILVAYVLGGMNAGAATAFSSIRLAYLVFSIPSLLPQIIVFGLSGDAVNSAMAGMLVFFWLLVTFSAETHRKTTIRSFTLRFENEGLVHSLRTAHDELEAKVVERTHDLSRANDRLREISREQSEFSRAVSHDLRAPLRIIIGFEDLMEQKYAQTLDAAGREYLRYVRQTAAHMNTIIDDLLTLSRVGIVDLRRSQVDLSGLAARIADDLHVSDPSRQVELRIQPGITADCDPGLMRIALENLMNNAWKYTGQTVGARIEFGSQCEGDRCVFYVRDNGAGFDMAHVSKLFEPFERLHSESEFPGTGLGLTTVRRVIRRHGGEIWARSDQRKETTFYFTL